MDNMPKTGAWNLRSRCDIGTTSFCFLNYASEAGWCCARKTGHELTFGGCRDLWRLEEQHCVPSFVDIVCHEKNNWVCTVMVHKLTHAYVRRRMLQFVFTIQHWQTCVMCSKSCEAADITERQKGAMQRDHQDQTPDFRLCLKATLVAGALDYSEQHSGLDNSPCALQWLHCQACADWSLPAHCLPSHPASNKTDVDRCYTFKCKQPGIHILQCTSCLHIQPQHENDSKTSWQTRCCQAMLSRRPLQYVCTT